MEEKLNISFISPHHTIYWYENSGRVKIVSTSHISHGRERKILINSNGYYSLRINRKSFVIHQFIGEKLFGKKKKGYCVNHIDGNKLNNSKSNLEYVTIRENIQHAVRTGLHVSSRPERHGNYKDGRAVKKNLNRYKYMWLKNKNEQKKKTK